MDPSILTTGDRNRSCFLLFGHSGSPCPGDILPHPYPIFVIFCYFDKDQWARWSLEEEVYISHGSRGMIHPEREESGKAAWTGIREFIAFIEITKQKEPARISGPVMYVLQQEHASYTFSKKWHQPGAKYSSAWDFWRTFLILHANHCVHHHNEIIHIVQGPNDKTVWGGSLAYQIKGIRWDLGAHIACNPGTSCVLLCWELPYWTFSHRSVPPCEHRQRSVPSSKPHFSTIRKAFNTH